MADRDDDGGASDDDDCAGDGADDHLVPQQAVPQQTVPQQAVPTASQGSVAFPCAFRFTKDW